MCRRSFPTGWRSNRFSATCSTTPSSTARPTGRRTSRCARARTADSASSSRSRTTAAASPSRTTSACSTCSAAPVRRISRARASASPMSARMIRNLGGDISLKSELDRGTTMTLNLPRDLRRIIREPRDVNQQAKPVTIIMIEDDEGHARLIEKNIRRAGVNNEIIPFTQRHRGSEVSARLGRLRQRQLRTAASDPARSQPARHDRHRHPRRRSRRTRTPSGRRSSC